MILCAIDQSDAARRIFDTAQRFADVWDASLVVVHAVSDSDRDSTGLVASLRDLLADGHPDVRLVEGSPARAVLEEADREGAELLVVGSRGRGPVRSGLLGSVSRELVSNARCPVVVVPTGDRWAGQELADHADASVVCGVDGSEQAMAAATLAGQLAMRFGWRLVIVHARQNLRAVASYPGASGATPPFSGQEDATKRLAGEIIQQAEDVAGVSAVAVVEPGPPAEVLEAVAEAEGARLIVVAARGIGPVRAAVLGSVATQLPTIAARPVVVLSEPAAVAIAQAAP